MDRYKIMKVARASEKDLEQLSRLQKEYMQYHKELDSYFSFREDISTLWQEHAKEILEDEKQVIFIAINDEQTVGYITAGIMKKAPIYEISEVGVIGDAFVLPEFREQGIFKELTEAVFNWMQEKNIRYVEHPVAAGNTLGLEAWKSRGFEEYMVWLRKKL